MATCMANDAVFALVLRAQRHGWRVAAESGWCVEMCRGGRRIVVYPVVAGYAGVSLRTW